MNDVPICFLENMVHTSFNKFPKETKMKKILLGVLLAAFVVVGIANHASAMGRKGRSSGGSNHHQGSSNSGSQSHENNSSPQDQGSSGQTFGDNQNHDEDFQENNNDENSQGNNPLNDNPVESFYEDNPGDDKFPAATPVPEPATLSLLGMGLAAVLLKQRKR